MRSFLFAVLLLVISLNIHGQIRSARQKMLLYDYTAAITLLEKDFQSGKEDMQQEAAQLLAECYRRQNNMEKAKEWYLKAINLGNKEPLNIFYLAVCLRSGGDYTQAKKYFLIYDSLSTGDNRGKTNADFCDSAIAWHKRKPDFEIWNAGELNSPQSDFAAINTSGKIFFVSDRTSGKSEPAYGWTGNSYLRIYQSDILQYDSSILIFKDPVESPGTLNQSWHDGPLCFNKTMDEVFINRTVVRSDKGRRDAGLVRTYLLKIYHAVKKDGNWTKPEPFFLNSDKYSVGHPALSPDGNTLYFVSDMEGGYGGTDIWLCFRTSDGWGMPVNPGRIINTDGNEMFPSPSDNDELYFASDGHPGFGGLDIFFTRKHGDIWEKPFNPGLPLNSSRDDFAFDLFPEGNIGTFSSNRPEGLGSDDIYCFRSIPSPEKTPSALPAVMEFPEKIPESLAVGKTYRIENIYYDFDKWNIRKDAEHSLDSLVKILKEYPVTVEIGSHTDCRGSVDYNVILSQKRAESVVGYLVRQGINSSRLSARGYGKSQLVNNCNCEINIQCTKPQHQENRRTEFRITGVIKSQ